MPATNLSHRTLACKAYFATELLQQLHKMADFKLQKSFPYCPNLTQLTYMHHSFYLILPNTDTSIFYISSMNLLAFHDMPTHYSDLKTCKTPSAVLIASLPTVLHSRRLYIQRHKACYRRPLRSPRHCRCAGFEKAPFKRSHCLFLVWLRFCLQWRKSWVNIWSIFSVSQRVPEHLSLWLDKKHLHARMLMSSLVMHFLDSISFVSETQGNGNFKKLKRWIAKSFFDQAEWPDGGLSSMGGVVLDLVSCFSLLQVWGAQW